jgi:hypothetical protein
VPPAMHATSNPPELVAPPQDSAADPYCGTPLGVEAAWWPNGLELPASPETAAQPMEL